MSRSLRRRRSPLVVCALVLAAALVLSFIPASASVTPFQSSQSLRFELPSNANLRVENLRGVVIAEVWSEPYVSIAAVTDSGEPIRSPAIIESSDRLLSVRVPRSPAKAPVNLELRIPSRTHAAIFTGNGSVEVRGLPSALLIQTVSGEIRIDVPNSANATLVAESRTGNVSSSVPSAAASQSQRPQLRARLGKGSGTVRLFSQAGNIVLGAQTQAAGVPARTQPIAPERRETLSAPQPTPPADRPELVGAGQQKPGAGIPARPSGTPEEVSEDDVIRVDTELVSVNVSVVDRGTNRGVNNLSKGDFRLYEDNVTQEVLHFESSSAPFNLVLLIDLSGSTANVVELIKSAASHFVDAARPFDRIGVITFAGDQAVVSPLTTDRVALHQRIREIRRPDGSTKLYDSLSFAMNEVFRQAKDSRRNAIVVISDGLDSVMPNVTGEGSRLTYQEVLRQAREFDGVIYTIWTETQSYEPLSPGDIQQATFDLAHDQMKEIADEGGGAFYECFKLEDLAGSYDRVVADLGTLYTLSYRPTNKLRDGSWRAIRVTVSRQGAVARGKRGYFAN
ncbi:MAG TPA: VWA domain-containing protein [Pyrinomonadaceae bacterium]|nr:VWA domain-containing protein [Pyrinomonadaceae bacterium]